MHKTLIYNLAEHKLNLMVKVKITTNKTQQKQEKTTSIQGKIIRLELNGPLSAKVMWLIEHIKGT